MINLSTTPKDQILPDGDFKPPSVIIQAQQGWGRLQLKELWQYRSLLRTLILRDTKSRYRATAVGPFWFIIGPFINMVILSLVFGRMAQFDSEGMPYPIFLYTATLPWSLFANSFERARGSLLEYMSWISKVYIPHLMIPLVSIGTNLLEWAISFLILLGLMVFYQIHITWSILLLPFYLVLALVSALSLSLWVAPLSVPFRDVGRFSSYVIQALYFLTPIVYSSEIIPEEWLWAYQLNPMYWVVEGFRWIFLGTGQGPQWYMLIPIGMVIALLISGAYVFERFSRNIVDIQ